MACEEKCFTFTWKIENVNKWLEQNKPIHSPSFEVDSINETKWHLLICPTDYAEEDFVSFALWRDFTSKGDDLVSVKYELAFLAADGSALTPWKAVKYDFRKGKLNEFLRFAKREDVFITRRSAFLPRDTLTARCRIWKCGGEMTEEVRCFARTRMPDSPVRKTSFFWNLPNFSSLESGRKYTHEVKSLDQQMFPLIKSLTAELDSKDKISFQINVHTQDSIFTTLILSLVDISGNKIECNRKEILFIKESESEEFKLFFTKNDLMRMKSSYLPNGVLSMHWEWLFTNVKGYKKAVLNAGTISENDSFSAQNVCDQNVVPLYPLNENLKSLYDEKFLCDVQLKTSTRTFNAHKLVLSAASSVFKAMFSSDMKEKCTNSVHIEDMSDDTISSMLAYIYTARVEDLTWEKASLLYAAAHKYAISNLMNVSSSYMKDNLSITNACEVLLLSEFHSDDDLKSCVQDYMLKHLKEIVKSDEWKLLMKTNSILAAETLSLPYK